jgi:hypothetical protein
MPHQGEQPWSDGPGSQIRGRLSFQPAESRYEPGMEQCEWGHLDDYLPKCDAEAFGWVHAIWHDPPCGNKGCTGHGNDIGAPLCKDHIDDLRRRVPEDAQFWVD